MGSPKSKIKRYILFIPVSYSNTTVVIKDFDKLNSCRVDGVRPVSFPGGVRTFL